jgi:hypothetical protein
MKSVDKAFNKGIQQEWNDFNKRQEQIKNIIKKRKSERERKQIVIKEGEIKVMLDYNKTCDNICQRNMGTERIYETKTINNWRRILRRIFRLT